MSFQLEIIFRTFNFHLSPSLLYSPCNELNLILDQLQQTTFLPFPLEKKAHLRETKRKIYHLRSSDFFLSLSTSQLNSHGAPHTPTLSLVTLPGAAEPGYHDSPEVQREGYCTPWQILDFFQPADVIDQATSRTRHFRQTVGRHTDITNKVIYLDENF